MKITAVTTAVVQASFDDTYVRVHTDVGISTGRASASRRAGTREPPVR
jgi:hypothetical protein